MNLPTMTEETRADFLEGIDSLIADMQHDYPSVPAERVLAATFLALGTVIELLPEHFADATWSTAEHTLRELFGEPVDDEVNDD